MTISERRHFIRISYGPEARPSLTIAGRRFEVVDISEGGIRFSNPEGVSLSRRVTGRLEMLSGNSIDIEGRIEWHQAGEAGIFLERLIPAELIEAEKRHTILKT